MDTISKRWAKLEPHVRMYGTDDGVPRPAVVLFHGCGGVRSHIHAYAEQAASIGWRAFVVDSFAARGWSRTYGVALVCSGVKFRGAERAGDVLASVWGLGQRADVDAGKLVLAGWSHGSWSIMDLMTMPLAKRGEAGLTDASDAALSGVRGLFLVYPYGGLAALSHTRPWVRKAPVLGVMTTKDHVTPIARAESLYEAVRRSGVPVELWRVEATHAFDEKGAGAPLMRHDPKLTLEAYERFKGFLTASAEPAPSQ